MEEKNFKLSAKQVIQAISIVVISAVLSKAFCFALKGNSVLTLLCAAAVYVLSGIVMLVFYAQRKAVFSLRGVIEYACSIAVLGLIVFWIAFPDREYVAFAGMFIAFVLLIETGKLPAACKRRGNSC